MVEWINQLFYGRTLEHYSEAKTSKVKEHCLRLNTLENRLQVTHFTPEV